MADCTVQTGSPADAAEIADLVNRAYRGEGEAGWTNEAGLVEGARTSPGEILRMMEEGLFLCARDRASGELVGSVYTEVQGAGEDASLYFGMLSVAPVRQNAGLGRLLMERCEARACELGLGTVSLTVLSPRTELQAWYMRHGFVATGETLPFPHGGPWHLVVYRKACENGTMPPTGLCGICAHTRALSNNRGSTFHMCERGLHDPAYPKYPRLPVLRCAGFEERTTSWQEKTSADDR